MAQTHVIGPFALAGNPLGYALTNRSTRMDQRRPRSWGRLVLILTHDGAPQAGIDACAEVFAANGRALLPRALFTKWIFRHDRRPQGSPPQGDADRAVGFGGEVAAYANPRDREPCLLLRGATRSYSGNRWRARTKDIDGRQGSSRGCRLRCDETSYSPRQTEQHFGERLA